MKKYNPVITTAVALLFWAAMSVATVAQHEGHGAQKTPAQGGQRQPEPQPCVRMEMPAMTPNNPLATAYLQNIATLTRALRDHVQQCGSVNGDFARDVTAEIWRNFDHLDRCRQEQMEMIQGGAPMGAMRDHASMAMSAPSEYLALREIGAERGALTPRSPAVQGEMNAQAGGRSDGHMRSQTVGQMNGSMAGQMTGQTMEMMRRMEAFLTRLGARLVELERETGAANPNPKWVLEHTNAILRLLDEMSTTHGGNCPARSNN